MSTNDNTGRIQIHGHGIGEISERDVEQRAGELARMDGRHDIKSQDRVRAREELEHPGPSPAPEADETESPIQHWSSARASHGERAFSAVSDDEVSPGERLVNEGLEEADRDQRLSASDNPEE